MIPITTQDKHFEREVLQSNILTIAYFWTSWSRPCRTITSILTDVAENYKDKVKFVSINADDNLKISKVLRIVWIPTVIYFVNGIDVERFEGFSSVKFIDATIKRLLVSRR